MGRELIEVIGVCRGDCLDKVPIECGGLGVGQDHPLVVNDSLKLSVYRAVLLMQPGRPFVKAGFLLPELVADFAGYLQLLAEVVDAPLQRLQLVVGVEIV